MLCCLAFNLSKTSNSISFNFLVMIVSLAATALLGLNLSESFLRILPKVTSSCISSKYLDLYNFSKLTKCWYNSSSGILLNIFKWSIKSFMASKFLIVLVNGSTSKLKTLLFEMLKLSKTLWSGWFTSNWNLNLSFRKAAPKCIFLPVWVLKWDFIFRAL